MPEFIDNMLAGFRRMRGAPTKTLGRSGTAIYGGHIQETETDATITGVQKYRTYSEILANVSIVAASVRHFLNLTARAGWKVEPADVDGPGATKAKELAELVEKMLYDMTTPWPRVVRRTAMFKFHGFSIQEWTAKRREDGTIGMKDIEARPQVTIERWDLDVTGTVHGVVQRSPQNGEEIYLPRQKLVYAVDDALKDSPEGLGIFRHLADPSKRLRRFQLLEAWGYETDLRGMPIARAPLAVLRQLVKKGDLTQAQMNAIIAPMETFIEKHVVNPALGMMLDSMTYQTTDERKAPSSIYQYTLELLKGNSALSSEAVMKAIERITREMARIMGTEFMLLGGDGTGSLALSRNKTAQFALIIDSTLTELADTYTADIVRPLFQLNGWPMELMPKLKPDATLFQDVEQMTGALADLAQAGAPLLPEDPAVGEVLDILGLSRPQVVSSLEDASLAEGRERPAAERTTNDRELPDDAEAEAEETTE